MTISALSQKNLKEILHQKHHRSTGRTLENILLEDSFDKATSGTFDSPIERISADDYAEMPGWSVNSAIVAKRHVRHIRRDDSRRTPYGGGTMVTPASAFAEGDTTISFRLQSSKPSEDQITVYASATTTKPAPKYLTCLPTALSTRP